MCLLDLIRLHVTHSHKSKRKYTSYSRSISEYTDMSMINWSRRCPPTHSDSRMLLLQISDLEDGINSSIPSIPDSICCSEFIINGGYCSENHPLDGEDRADLLPRPWPRTCLYMGPRSPI
ncbi:hypothetical protein CBL_09575 [Carabus blaptoides fortunei]